MEIVKVGATRTIIMALVIAAMICAASCKQSTTVNVLTRPAQPEWVANATIYEVNLRQYTHNGTFAAFAEHLPRLKELGVDILWFMPIHPIGVVDRKGTLGSYYSVSDYYGINPEFGTLDDFKALVSKIHSLGMRVIIDVVANHTSRDAVLLTQHPEWYLYDATGKPIAPFDWTDVAKLDYSKPELRTYMIDMLKYWANDVGVDGFRCDVAAEVTVDFWNSASAELNAIKPVFMLAEAETPALVEHAFVADYAWECHHIMNSICKGEKNVDSLVNYLLKKVATYPVDVFKMNFITNHDENSWNGTEFERMGDATKTMAVLTYALDGMPLIYSGQEVGFDRRLKFFDKDSIDWTDNQNMTAFYTKLNSLKHNYSALNAVGGAPIMRVNTNANAHVFAFVREDDNHKLFFVFNLSAQPQQITLHGDAFVGKYTDHFTAATVEFAPEQQLNLEPWAYRIYVR